MADQGCNSDSADQFLDKGMEDIDNDSEYEYEYCDVDEKDLDDEKSFSNDESDHRNKSSADTCNNTDCHEYAIEIGKHIQTITLDQLFAICRVKLHSSNDYRTAKLYLRRNPDAAKAVSNDGMHFLHVMACL